MSNNPLFGPGLNPPQGVVPDFSHPGKTLQPLINGISTTCLVMVSISVPLRLYTKLFVMKKLLLEDGKSIVIL